MVKNGNFLITKPEIKFWGFIFGLLLGGIAAFYALKAEVKDVRAQVDNIIQREELNKQQFYEEIERSKERDKILIEVRDSVLKIEKDLEYIKLRI